MQQSLADAKAKGATPIVLSPIPRNIWKDGRVARNAGDYGKWALEAAKAGGAGFIDLNEIIAKRYEAEGQSRVATDYFGATDHTHTTPSGARLNAQSVVEGIRALADCRLRDYLAAGAQK